MFIPKNLVFKRSYFACVERKILDESCVGIAANYRSGNHHNECQFYARGNRRGSNSPGICGRTGGDVRCDNAVLHCGHIQRLNTHQYGTEWLVVRECIWFRWQNLGSSHFSDRVSFLFFLSSCRLTSKPNKAPKIALNKIKNASSISQNNEIDISHPSHWSKVFLKTTIRNNPITVIMIARLTVSRSFRPDLLLLVKLPP